MTNSSITTQNNGPHLISPSSQEKHTTSLNNQSSHYLDRLVGLLEREKKYPCVNLPSTWTSKDRIKMVEWFFTVADFKGIDRSAVSTSIKITDSMLSKYRPEKDENATQYHQLSAMIALHLATKLSGKQISLSDLSTLSRDQFEVTDLENHEVEVLKSLEWRVTPTIPQEFISEYISWLYSQTNQSKESIESICNISNYQIEISAFHPDEFSHIPSSELALSAVLNAIQYEVSGYRLYTRRGDFQLIYAQPTDNNTSVFDQEKFEDFVFTSVLDNHNVIPHLMEIRVNMQKSISFLFRE